MKEKTDKNPFFIGLLSFFGGISQDLIVPIIPLYLATVLNLPKSLIGIVEGLVTSSASIFKIVSGFLTDRFSKRKPIVFLGYFLSFVDRPLLAFTASGAGVLALRFLDGIGKGLKDSPKDALIADSTIKETRGRSFGVVRMLDTFGSVVGPLILFLLLFVFKDNPHKYQYLFLISAVPLLVTLAIISFLVKEVSFEKKYTPELGLNLPLKFYLFLA